MEKVWALSSLSGHDSFSLSVVVFFKSIVCLQREPSILMSHSRPIGWARRVQTCLAHWCTLFHFMKPTSHFLSKLFWWLPVRWLKLIVFSFITPGCQRRWICRCVYCLCWHICTICDTKREISDSTQKKLPIPTRNYHYNSLSQTGTHNHSESETTLVTFMYLHAFMHTWPAFMIVIASLWFDKSLFKMFMPQHCLGFCSSYCFTHSQMTYTLLALVHISVFLCRYDSYGRLTNVTYPTGRVSSYRTDADSSVRIQTEGSNKEEITVTTNLSASGTFYTLMQGECLLL